VIVVGALAWYAETEQTLERCARSLGGVCDILVALGGRWQGFPAMPLDDADAQARAIKRGADQADISFCAVSWTREPFRSQVAKRAELMLAARTLGDWVLVIDADEYVATANTDELETTLAATHADVATVAGIRVPITASSVRRPWRRIYRASTGVTVETAHNGYRAEDGRWLYGDPAHVQLEPAVDVRDHLLIAHDIEARGGERKDARKLYLEARRVQVLEAWPEKVPA